jgi:hypothetical protein
LPLPKDLEKMKDTLCNHQLLLGKRIQMALDMLVQLKIVTKKEFELKPLLDKNILLGNLDS